MNRIGVVSVARCCRLCEQYP